MEVWFCGKLGNEGKFESKKLEKYDDIIEANFIIIFLKQNKITKR